MTYKTFDTIPEQADTLEDIAENIEGFWLALAEGEHAKGTLTDCAVSDAKALRLIASKIREKAA